MHAAYMIQMLDSALDLLGPDIELLTEILMDLGAKHQRYGVHPDMFGVMGDSLFQILETFLGDREFDAATRAAWKEVYAELSHEMIQARK